MTEGIQDSEVLHKLQSEVAQSAVKHCNELQSEVCLRQDEVWELYFEERRGHVPYGVLFQRFVGNTVLGVPILNPSVFLQAKSHLPLTREA